MVMCSALYATTEGNLTYMIHKTTLKSCCKLLHWHLNPRDLKVLTILKNLLAVIDAAFQGDIKVLANLCLSDFVTCMNLELCVRAVHQVNC